MCQGNPRTVKGGLMSSLERRVDRLEGGARPERERETWRECIRGEAERVNDNRAREGKERLFEIAEDGTVYTRDGRLVDSFHQSGAEAFYWQEVEWGGPGLIHDEKAEAFFTPGGELAVSRVRFDLRHLLGR